MNKTIILGLLIIGILVISGCTQQKRDVLNPENIQLIKTYRDNSQNCGRGLITNDLCKRTEEEGWGWTSGYPNVACNSVEYNINQNVLCDIYVDGELINTKHKFEFSLTGGDYKIPFGGFHLIRDHENTLLGLDIFKDHTITFCCCGLSSSKTSYDNNYIKSKNTCTIKLEDKNYEVCKSITLEKLCD